MSPLVLLVTTLIGAVTILSVIMAPVWLPEVFRFLERRRQEKRETLREQRAHELEMERIKLRMLEGPSAPGDGP